MPQAAVHFQEVDLNWGIQVYGAPWHWQDAGSVTSLQCVRALALLPSWHLQRYLNHRIKFHKCAGYVEAGKACPVVVPSSFALNFLFSQRTKTIKERSASVQLVFEKSRFTDSAVKVVATPEDAAPPSGKGVKKRSGQLAPVQVCSKNCARPGGRNGKGD